MGVPKIPFSKIIPGGYRKKSNINSYTLILFNYYNLNDTLPRYDNNKYITYN